MLPSTNDAAATLQALSPWPQWLSTREAGKLWGVTDTTVRKILARGEVRYTKIGRCAKIHRQDAFDYLHRHTVNATK